jgi:hypothetical protein
MKLDLFNLTRAHQKRANVLLVLLALVCMALGWYLWPGAPHVKTLGELPLEWLSYVFLSLYCWWQGYSLVVTTFFSKS